MANNCYCKRTFDNSNGKTIFIKGNKYEYRIENTWYSFENEAYWVIYDNNGGLYDSGFRFYHKDYYIRIDENNYHFCDYFLTEQEYRKIKLEKLNESNMQRL